MSDSAGAVVTAAVIAQPQAVLFDMDGVITDTAKAHAAWQRLAGVQTEHGARS